ncbi:MAG: hypothetical protein GX094_04180 [Clostridiales bacterium]|nr:hypothetical protein [Clostridiales bacterium]
MIPPVSGRDGFYKEGGLVNASYPPSAKPRFSTYRNLQAEANWTGIEYAFSSMLIDSGMFHEGYEIIKNIHERYSREGMIWNHIECGEHYYRAMSSWAVLLAVTGFKIDVPRGIVTFRPVNLQPEFHGLWVSSTGWGHFIRSRKRFVLNCYSGTLAFRKIRIILPGTDINNLKAYLNGKMLTTCLYLRDSLVEADFGMTLTVKEGDIFVVE